MSDRRSGAERRGRAVRMPDDIRAATWKEQLTQFLTRFLFLILGFAYYNLNDGPPGLWPDKFSVNVVFTAYGVLVMLTWWHARRELYSRRRWRLAMWLDAAVASFAVLADPVAVSPAYVLYLMIVLGNGLRYGQRFFSEGVVVCLIAALMTVGIRFMVDQGSLNMGVIYLLVFSVIIVLYAYFQSAELSRAYKRLEQLSSIDLLTGLLNRRGLYEKAQELFREIDREHRELAVLFADLDKFKSVNDELGHYAGDRVLAEIGSTLSSCVRGSDVVSRFGGDEFVLLLPDASLSQAVVAAGRIQDALRSWAQNERLDLSVSIGIGTAPRDGLDFAAVLHHVDQAMYRSKAACAGGIYCLHPDDIPAGSGGDREVVEATT